MEPRLKFNVRNQKIERVDSFYVVEKSKNYLYADFEFFTPDWENVSVKTAIFEYKGGAIKVVLDGDSCLVPWECIENVGEVHVTVFGGDLITVSSAVFKVNQSGYKEATAPKPPTDNVYAQLTKMVGDNKQYAIQAAESANSAKESAKQSGDYANSAKIESDNAAESANKAKEYHDTITVMADEISKKAVQISENATKSEMAVEEITQEGERIKAEGEKQLQNVKQEAEETLDAIRGLGVIDIGEELKEYCTSAKENIKKAIINKGGQVSDADSLNEYADRINGIPNGIQPTETLPKQTILISECLYETGEILLKWEKVDASGYLIIKKKDSAPISTADGEKIYKGEELNYSDKDLVSGSKYFYRIFPYNNKGQYQAELSRSVCEVDYVDRKDAILIKNLNVDDQIKFGRYNGVDLHWIICDTLDKPKGYVTVSSVEEINDTFFTFDMQENESGNENPIELRRNGGNNRWSVSNLRKIMNSDKPRGEWYVKQHDYDTAPSYATERDGFLKDFTDFEKQIIVPKTNICKLAEEDGGGSETTIDTLWLASYYALGCGITQPLEDDHIYEKFTDDKSRIFQDRRYWTRTINANSASGVRNVSETGIGSSMNAYQLLSGSYGCVLRTFCLLPTSAYVKWSDADNSYIFIDDLERKSAN